MNLIEKYFEITNDIMTKREIEWMLGDFINVIYFLIIIIGCLFTFIVSGAWMTILALVLTFALIGAWAWAAYHIRKTLLFMLYPSKLGSRDENGDEIINIQKALGQLDQIVASFNS